MVITGNTKRYAIQKKAELKKTWTTVFSDGARFSRAIANQKDRPLRMRKKNRTIYAMGE
jgi:hypothetical protein